MKKITLLIILTYSIFLSSPTLQADSQYSASNYAEIACAALRGPLVGISNYYYTHNQHSGKARVVHLATDCLRLVNIILNSKNHPNDLKKYTLMWGLIDGVNLLIDSLHANPATTDEKNRHNDQLFCDDEEYQKAYVLIKKLFAGLAYGILPAIESGTALTNALSVDCGESNLNNSLLRLRLQAIQSLGRSINMFINAKTKKEKISAALFVLINIPIMAEDFSSDRLQQAPEKAVVRPPERSLHVEFSQENGVVIIIRRTDETVDRIALGFLIPGTNRVIPGDSTFRICTCCNRVEVIQHVLDIATFYVCQNNNANDFCYDINITPDNSAWLQVQFEERQMRAFQTLELEPTATDDEIRRRYRVLSLRYHPDRNNTSESVGRMQNINTAYDFLLHRNQ